MLLLFICQTNVNTSTPCTYHDPLIILLNFCLFHFSNISLCFPNDFFLFNVSYEECDPGYYWVNCSKTCEYPYFGAKCAHNCSCEKQLCNVMIGCANGEYNDQYVNYLSKFYETQLRRLI